MSLDTVKDEDLKEDKDVESSDKEGRKIEDFEKAVPLEEKLEVISPITLQKPLKMNNTTNLPLKKLTNPLKLSNPLASKKSDNPPKSGLKKEDMNTEDVFNDDGKRPLPKTVEIMDEELERSKKFREE